MYKLGDLLELSTLVDQCLLPKMQNYSKLASKLKGALLAVVRADSYANCWMPLFVTFLIDWVPVESTQWISPAASFIDPNFSPFTW